MYINIYINYTYICVCVCIQGVCVCIQGAFPNANYFWGNCKSVAK